MAGCADLDEPIPPRDTAAARSSAMPQAQFGPIAGLAPTPIERVAKTVQGVRSRNAAAPEPIVGDRAMPATGSSVRDRGALVHRGRVCEPSHGLQPRGFGVRARRGPLPRFERQIKYDIVDCYRRFGEGTRGRGAGRRRTRRARTSVRRPEGRGGASTEGITARYCEIYRLRAFGGSCQHKIRFGKRSSDLMPAERGPESPEQIGETQHRDD